MDFKRTSLKVSAAALLTAPVLLTPLASTNHYGSLAHRLAHHRPPMIATDALEHGMHALVTDYAAPRQTPAVLGSLASTGHATEERPALLPAEKPAEATQISLLAPASTEVTSVQLPAPGPADALSAIRSLGGIGESTKDTPAEATAYAPQPDLRAPADLPTQADLAGRLGVDLTGLREALAFYKAGDVGAGDRVAAGAPDPLVRTTLEWVALRTNQRGTGFKRIAKFLDAHPGWPSGPWMRKRAEEALYTDNPPPARVKEYFTEGKPQTVAGKLALARALLGEGRKSEAAELVRSAWRDGDLNQWLEGTIKKTFAEFLEKGDYKYRADRLLYKEDISGAMRSAQSAGSDVVLLAKARIAVINEAASDKAIAAVPPTLQNDPGLLFSKIQKLRRADKIDEAVRILLDAPRDLALIINGDEWWVERRLLSRKLLDRGDFKTAYRLCDEHSAQKTDVRVEAEFHAGWIALRFLNDLDAAARHFAIAAVVAETPMSVARVAYWQGRTAEAAGNAKALEAVEFYRKAAKHSATFYGQLARTKLGLPAGQVRVAPVAAEGNQRDEAVRTIELLYTTGEKELALPLVTESAQRLESPEQMAALARIIAKDRDAKVSLSFGKLAAQRGMALDDLAYPGYGIPNYQPLGNSAPKSVVYSIARQESAFQTRARSGAGAKGLMQMLSATARRTASRIGVGFNEARLINDATFNAQLGAAHLGELLAEQGGSYILTFAAYNAGGGHVKEWIDAYGDPRDPKVDPVDWVERIPFTETRNYVQRVMENLTIYRARFEEAGPAPVQTDLRQVAAKL